MELIPLGDKGFIDKLITIKQSNLKRDWMDATHNLNAYRCLPMNIANQNGWSIYLNNPIKFAWNGDITNDAIAILDNSGVMVQNIVQSWFGHGIISFRIPYLIKLDKGYNLYITGAPNHHMLGLQPCSGIFEADWAPYTFTMNWRIMQKNRIIEFKETDPICFFFPIEQKLVEETEIRYSTLEEQDPYFVEMHHKFSVDRAHTHQLGIEDYWEKKYFQGLYPDGQKCPYDHKTKIKTKPIK